LAKHAAAATSSRTGWQQQANGVRGNIVKFSGADLVDLRELDLVVRRADLRGIGQQDEHLLRRFLALVDAVLNCLHLEVAAFGVDVVRLVDDDLQARR